MSKILMVYGSAYGQTGRIVRRIAWLLGRDGHEVTVWKGDELPPGADPAPFDGYVVAGSVRLGKHQPYLREFVREHADLLNRAPSAFISVCGVLGGTTPDAKQQARKYVDQFLEQTGWHPQVVQSFAGALNYRDYSLPIRWMMKLISWRTGRPTDTSRNYEFTDWERVERFAGELAVGFAELAPASL